MKKREALQLFGGVRATARAVGVAAGSVSKWRDPLSPRVRDRVLAALLRAGRVSDAIGCAEGKHE